MPEYPILDVPAAWRERLEELGSKPKFWYFDERGELRLFKEGRKGTGENWAEKIAAELCRSLGLPHAEYDLARCGGIEGVSTPSLVSPGERLVLANEVLTRVMRGYGTEPRYKRKNHTVALLRLVLGNPDVAPPAGCALPKGIAQCDDVFVGYLLLDAWIGNTDRHDENWGYIVRPTASSSRIHLAPTFDHASSLGRSLSDADQAKRLATKDARFSVGSYALKARSALYKTASSSKPLSCIDAFEAFSEHKKAARSIWLENLNSVDTNAVFRILERVPKGLMSDVSKEFAAAFLNATKRSLLQSPENRR